MVDKFINIPNDDKQNYCFCRLKLLVKSLDTISLLRVPKVFVPTNKRTIHFRFKRGSRIIYRPFSYPVWLTRNTFLPWNTHKVHLIENIFIRERPLEEISVLLPTYKPILDNFFKIKQQEKVIYTSYYRQLSVDSKIKNYKIKTSFVSPEWPKSQSN